MSDITIINNQNGVQSVRLPGGFGLRIDQNTFSNCQNFTIGAFSNFMNYSKGKNRKESLKELKKVCGIYKAILIVDVKARVASVVKKEFEVIGSTEYMSSNGNKMFIIVIDTRK